MLAKHSALGEKYLRSIPIIGLVFLYWRSKRDFKMAKENDSAFLSMMKDLGREPEYRLLDQNVRLEKRLIFVSFVSLSLSWILSFILLNHLNYMLTIVLAMCNAFCMEWLLLELVTKLSFKVSNGKN